MLAVDLSQIPLLVVNIILLLFTLTILLIRLYVRRNLLHNLGWDDYICTLAAIGSVIHLSLIIAFFSLRFGKDLEDAYSAFLLDRLYLQLSNATQIFYPLVIYGVKLSILLLYKRVFTVDSRMNFMIDAAILTMALLYTIYLCFGITSTIQCVDAISLNARSLCKNAFHVLLSQDILNVVTDIFVLVLPLRAIRKLQLKRRQKLGVIVIFGAGLIPCCIALARACSLIITSTEGILVWENLLLRYFAALEINVAIIVACAPTLPAFLAHVKHSIRKRQRSSYTEFVRQADYSQPGMIELSESKEELQPHTEPALEIMSTELSLEGHCSSKEDIVIEQRASASTIPGR